MTSMCVSKPSCLNTSWSANPAISSATVYGNLMCLVIVKITAVTAKKKATKSVPSMSVSALCMSLSIVPIFISKNYMCCIYIHTRYVL